MTESEYLKKQTKEILWKQGIYVSPQRMEDLTKAALSGATPESNICMCWPDDLTIRILRILIIGVRNAARKEKQHDRCRTVGP
jgi:hypothetical protein